MNRVRLEVQQPEVIVLPIQPCKECGLSALGDHCELCKIRLDYEAKLKERAIQLLEVQAEKFCPGCIYELLVLYHKDDSITETIYLPTDADQKYFRKELVVVRQKPARERTKEIVFGIRTIPCGVHSGEARQYREAQESLAERLSAEQYPKNEQTGQDPDPDEETLTKVFQCDGDIRPQDHAPLVNTPETHSIQLSYYVKETLWRIRGKGKLYVEKDLGNGKKGYVPVGNERLIRVRALLDLARRLKQSYCEWPTDPGVSCRKPVAKYSHRPYCEEHKLEYRRVMALDRSKLNRKLKQKEKARRSGVLFDIRSK
jgi:hypothetical protein